MAVSCKPKGKDNGPLGFFRENKCDTREGRVIKDNHDATHYEGLLLPLLFDSYVRSTQARMGKYFTCERKVPVKGLDTLSD